MATIRRERSEVASFRKKGKAWYYRFTDSDGKQYERKGCSDLRETEAMAGAAEAEASKVKSGYIGVKDKSVRHHQTRRLVEQVDDWRADLVAQGHTDKHAAHTSNRVRRLVAVIFRITDSPS